MTKLGSVSNAGGPEPALSFQRLVSKTQYLTVIYTRLCQFRDQSAASRAVAGGGEANILWQEMNLPKMQQVCDFKHIVEKYVEIICAIVIAHACRV